MKINIIEKENKWWSETKKKINSYKPEDYQIFKTWEVVNSIPIYKTNELFEQYRNDVEMLFSTIPEDRRAVWKAALKEPFLGHTDESYADAKKIIQLDGEDIETTPFTLKCAHYVLNYQTMSGKDILEYEQIVDFGAGIGELARFIRDLGFKGDYTILDLPEIGSISKYYNQELNKNIVHAGSYKDIPNDKKTLFIGTWSLSEVPFSYRNEICEHFFEQDYLIVFQSKVFEYSNNEYFMLEFPFRSGTYTRLRPIPFHTGGGGNFFVAATSFKKG
jgi:hypothetical protein